MNFRRVCMIDSFLGLRVIVRLSGAILDSFAVMPALG